MARTLDKSKPYGEIFHSEASDGRRYEQNNVSFDAQGNEWTEPAAKEATAPDLAHPSVQAAIDAAVAAAVTAALAAQAKVNEPKNDPKLDKNLKG